MTNIISAKLEAEHKYIIKRSRFYWFGLKRIPITTLQKYYKGLEGQYKDITETKETAGGTKGIKDSNDSTSPSSLFFIKGFVV
jgi:hypothetical protein